MIVAQGHDIIIKELEANGFVHLQNQSEELLLSHLNKLGKVIFKTDVKVKPDSRPLITSDRALDYHTDHHKAKYIVWYCHQQTDKGGESILIDAEKVYTAMSNVDQQALTEIHLHEHKVFPDDKESNPLVSIIGNKPRFYYSFWLVDDSDKQNSSLREFQRLLKSEKPMKLRLERNDILIIDNQRILHGRTAIEGSKDRYLKRYWIDNNQ
jgi:alpha-ketoglutarate-dependent taurine dioxygenase